MIPSRKRPETPERPITFHAESPSTLQLAELWADRTAWPITERTAYDELAELAVMSALAKWLTRWQPVAIHSAVLAGARMEPLPGRSATAFKWRSTAGTSGRRQRDFIFNGKPGITEDEYQDVARRFAAVGIKPAVL